MENSSRIVIIGAGFSGTLVACHLLRNAKKALHVTLIERRAEMGLGIAYGTHSLAHLLNVRALQMSAFADEPDSLVKWLETKYTGETFSADSFIPRQIYGKYLQDLLESSEKNAAAKFEKVFGEVISLTKKNDVYNVGVRGGGGMDIDADKVVLAIGNFPPSNPFPPNVRLPQANKSYFSDPWSVGAIEGLRGHDRVLLVGTGLTTIDVILSLEEQGFLGSMHAISRHGFLPHSHQSHASHAAVPDFIRDSIKEPISARTLLRAIRERLEQNPDGWRAVIDSLRPHIQSLWKSLPLVEKRRFLRHLKSFWDVHRHRIAPSIAQKIQNLRQNRRLFVQAGRLVEFQEVQDGVDVGIMPRNSSKKEILRVQRVINCSGPSYRHPGRISALLAELEKTGMMRSHELMGIDTDDFGALIDSNGVVSRDLFTLGSVRTGSLWESIAVRELRVQAAEVARRLLSPEL